MSEEIEVAPPESGDELVVTMNGEVLPPRRGPGRPPKIQQPQPSQQERAYKLLQRQGIGAQPGEEWLLENIWKSYCEHRKFFVPEQLPGYFIFRCSGCAGKHPGSHADNCTGVSVTAEVLWPPEATQYIANQMRLEFNCGSHLAFAAQRKLAFWHTEPGKLERRKELAAAVDWLKQHDYGDHAQWVTREHLLNFVGLAGIVGVPNKFDPETEADLAAALAAK